MCWYWCLLKIVGLSVVYTELPPCDRMVGPELTITTHQHGHMEERGMVTDSSIHLEYLCVHQEEEQWRKEECVLLVGPLLIRTCCIS